MKHTKPATTNTGHITVKNVTNTVNQKTVEAQC